MNEALRGTAKRGFLLVEFAYGDPSAQSYVRLTDSNVRLDVLGATWESDPKMELDLAPYTTGIAEKPSYINISNGTGTTFFDDIANGRAFSSTNVRVIEYTFTDNLGGGATEILYLLRGEMAGATRNPNGRSDLVRVEVLGAKSKMDFPVGIQANASCTNSLGDQLCGIDIRTLARDATITAIDGLDVEIAGLPARDYTFWHRGRVEYDGVRILVREWIEGTTFRLAQMPPMLWLDNITASGSQPVTVYPGCSKGTWACRNLHDNIGQFLGLGIKTPTHNPTFENPNQ